MSYRRFLSRRSSVFLLAIGAVLSLAVMADGRATQTGPTTKQPHAMSEAANPNGRSGMLFPLAERRPPKNTLTAKQDFRMNTVVALYNEGRRVEARVAADEILADSTSTVFEKAGAAQIAAQAAFEIGERNAAIAYYQDVIQLDALDNDAHYGAMRNLALLQQQQKRYAESVSMYDRFFAETGTRNLQDLLMKGQSLYLMGRYPEAAMVIEQAIGASAEPNPQWQALLMQAHMKAGKSAEALLLAEQVAVSSPGDKRVQMNLAVAYQRNAMPEKAAAVLEKLRGQGQLHEAGGYQQLYSIYIDLEGHEKQAIEVINEGLQNGALKPDFMTLETLAKL